MKLYKILTLLQQLRRLPSVYYIGGSDILPPPLSPEEEAEAAAACQTGDENARRRLIEHNLRLVVFLARKFESSGVGTEDLGQHLPQRPQGEARDLRLALYRERNPDVPA